MKVSVIIPVYNVENYIAECLESVVCQSLTEIEILCIDDCGTDNSMKIVNEYAKRYPNIRIIYHKKNLGLATARNTGIRNALGEYIGFVDSDDFISRNFYEVLYSIAKNKNADIVESTIYLYHDNNHTFEEYKLNRDIEDKNDSDTSINKLRLYRSSGMCWNKIYNRKLIIQHNIIFPEGLYWEDNPFVVKAAYYASKIQHASSVNYIYRQRQGSIVTLKHKKLHFDLLYTHLEIINFLNSVELEKNAYIQMSSWIIDRIWVEYKKLLQNWNLIGEDYKFYKVFCQLYNNILYKNELAKIQKKQLLKIRFGYLYRYVRPCILLQREIGKFLLFIIKFSYNLCKNISKQASNHILFK